VGLAASGAGGQTVAVTDFVRLAELDDDQLSRAYAPPRLPWLRMNFVATADGAAQGSDGLSGGINNAVDNRVFHALRSRADVVLVGAGTARAESYGPADVPLVLISRRTELPPKLAGLERGRVLLATVVGADGLDEARAALGAENVLVCGTEDVDLAQVKRHLDERGLREQLCEGGPALFAAGLSSGGVDELCLTLVPRVVAGDAYRITRGDAVDVDLELTHLLVQESTVLARYAVSGLSKPDLDG
jgi:riboflavin biosynthesis pyrimidine reductase